MKERMTIKEVIDRIVKVSGHTKKLSTELVHALPEVIEAGLARDGEVRVAGLGIFKLKWVKARTARNIKTGASIEVPAHSRVVFQPEQGLKQKVNADYRLLTYQAIEEEIIPPVPEYQETIIPVPETMESGISSVPEETTAKSTEEVKAPEIRKRKAIYWLIPLVFVIIALLAAIFYMKNCRDELSFPAKEQAEEEQVIQPSGPATPTAEPVMEDSSGVEMTEASGDLQETPPVEPTPAVPRAGFEERTFSTDNGEHLFQVARETYGNPFLWALIYLENRNQITDPAEVPHGTELVIPSLEGTPQNLSRNDSTRVAEGFRVLYNYYNDKGDEMAKDFLYAMNAFSPR